MDYYLGGLSTHVSSSYGYLEMHLNKMNVYSSAEDKFVLNEELVPQEDNDSCWMVLGFDNSFMDNIIAISNFFLFSM